MQRALNGSKSIPSIKKVSWDFNFDETKHSEGYYYRFTQCTLNNSARR